MKFFSKPKSNLIESMYYNELPSSIKMQLQALKSLDLYTKRHIEEVPKYVYKICMQLGIDGKDLDFIMVAAYLHDVGKIFVAPAILQKPGKLTQEEYEIMKTHAVKGYDVCMSLDDIRPYAKTVRGHHESLDGSGYPDGLVANQISYETCIIKVADVYSALSSKRQYKDPFTTKQIFEIMYNDVAQNKMRGDIVYALLMAIIEDKTDDLNEIKGNVKAYKKQLEYNEYIFNCLESYAKEKMNSNDVLSAIKTNRYIRKLNDFDINKISDANKLLIYINNNIANLTQNIKEYTDIEQDLKELMNYAKLVMKKM